MAICSGPIQASPHVKWNWPSSIKTLYMCCLESCQTTQNSWEISKYYENLNIGWQEILVSSLVSINEVLAVAVKDFAKAEIKVFRFPSILLDFHFLPNILPRVIVSNSEMPLYCFSLKQLDLAFLEIVFMRV